MIDRRQSSHERRQSARASFVAAVRSASDEAVELALAMDLSRTGMRLKRRAEDDPAAPSGNGPVVRIEFELPDGGEPVVAMAQLLFEQRDGNFSAAGMRFVELGLEDELRIARYVDGAAPATHAS